MTWENEKATRELLATYMLAGANVTLILLIMTIVVFNLFYFLIKSLMLGTKCVLKHQDLQLIDLKLNKYE